MIGKKLIFALFLNAILYCLPVCDAHKSVTYPGIGTFTDNDFYDIKWRPFVALPESPERIDPNYVLYNRKIQYNPQTLSFNNTDMIRMSHFDPKLETKILVHGFIDGPLINCWMYPMKDKILVTHDVNVILVDWSKSDFFPYTQATANARIAGAMTGIFIQNLINEFNVSPSSFHLIGHSLGAHVVGYAGKWLEGKLAHITGLDPAGPYFEGLTNPAARLWHTDAQFVESIHTDAHHLIPTLGFGMYETCSHIDFYPNGGVSQPGCDQERFTTIITKGLIHGITNLIACNHERSAYYYLEAYGEVESYPVAYACNSYDDYQNGQCTSCAHDGSNCAILGPKAINYKKFITDPSVSKGKRFFFSTAPHEKFFKFQYMIRVKMVDESHESDSVHGKITMKFLDWADHGETLKFNDHDQKFEKGHSYSRVILSDMKPSDLDRIHFKWTHGGLSLKHTRMYIDSIEVMPLSTESASLKSPDHWTFETDEFGISDGHEAIFKRS
uniref:Pancreatic triacylglycerol lipase-like n=1 Tax=Dermatophagoides pteronyssinus TaxID=6956 RepID=A0A6P6Y038_DERPT|nr:pancreatic triacylglycerol lipase-like [Dermatophagoides pteronyssinus]